MLRCVYCQDDIAQSFSTTGVFQCSLGNANISDHLPMCEGCWKNYKNIFESCPICRAPRHSIGVIKFVSSSTLFLLNFSSLDGVFETIENPENITSLIIRDNYIKNIPQSIERFKNLKVLMIKYNEHLTSLPDTIGNLERLKRLEIEWNNSLISLPSTIGNLGCLRILEISVIPLLVCIPDTIGNLVNLIKFSIWGNDSLTHLPDTIENLRNLKKLIIWDNVSFTSLPRTIRNLRNLKKLEILGNTSLTSFPEFYKKSEVFPNLRLNISDNLERFFIE